MKQFPLRDLAGCQEVLAIRCPVNGHYIFVQASVFAHQTERCELFRRGRCVPYVHLPRGRLKLLVRRVERVPGYRVPLQEGCRQG
jgi:hypothetical protein